MADQSETQRTGRRWLSLDWWAVITALVAVLLVWIGVIGNIPW